MARHHQWHSARGGELVHHDNEDCPEGRNIEYYWLRHNAGGRPLCAVCAELNGAGYRAATTRASMPEASTPLR